MILHDQILFHGLNSIVYIMLDSSFSNLSTLTTSLLCSTNVRVHKSTRVIYIERLTFIKRLVIIMQLEKSEKVYAEAAKLRFYIILFLGSLITLGFGYACALDWSMKIALSQDWTINLLYHPITEFLAILFGSILAMFFVVSKFPDSMERIESSISNQNTRFLLTFLLIVSFGALFVNSVQMLSSVSPLILATHILTGFVTGISAILLMIPRLVRMHQRNPTRTHDLLTALVVISVIISIAAVVIANAMGLLTLGHLQ